VLTRVTRYDSFDEMFDHESIASVNPWPPVTSKPWASSQSYAN
jgi:hypothetical protein